MESKVQKGHPKGLYLLFSTELWERFSYYGMRAIFVFYLTQALLLDKETASGIYGSYTGLVYLTPILGGYFADNIWGNRKSIFIGGVMMAIGQFFMFMSALNYTSPKLSVLLMVIGLTSLIFGNGFFKPNISTMVGQLYTETDTRKDSAYTIFYMGINLGAFFAPLLCGFVGQTGNPADFKWGFLLACIGMILSLVIFQRAKDKYLITPSGEPVGIEPNVLRLKNEAAKLGTTDSSITEVSKKGASNVLVGMIVGVAILFTLRFAVFFDGEGGVMDTVNNWISCFIFAGTVAFPLIIILDKSLTSIERSRILVIFIIAFFVIFFWAAFEQAGASLSFFAEEQTDRMIFGWEMPSSWFSSFNAIFIVILAPVVSILWTKLAKANREPASPYKQAFGLFFLAVGYMVIAMGVKGLDPSVKVSIFWLTSLYLIHTVGELFLSPIGLSMVNKLAPVRFASLLMGVWFLSTAAANNFAGFLSGFYPDPQLTRTEVRALEKEYSVNGHTAFLTDLKGKDSTSITFKKAGDEKISYSAIQFSTLFPETKVKAAQEANLKIVKKIKVDFARRAINVEKSFLGLHINNLNSFFMLFVYLAGGAAIILFLLSSVLVKMMKGIK
jgi:POT family proton-dependent oligopeptide transporter